MKILFYSDQFYPETSGVSDSIIELGRGLKSLGHEVGFVVPEYSKANYASVGKSQEEFLTKEGFEMCRTPSLSFSGSASGQGRTIIPFGYSIPFVRRFRPDIIHAQTPFGTGIEALVISRLFRIPLVGSNHTHIHEFIKIYGPIRKPWFEHLMQRFYSWYYNRCRFTSVVAHKLLDEMRAHKFIKNAAVIPNPLSLSTFSISTAEEKIRLRNEFGLNGPTIIYAGRIAAEKRLDVVVKAFKHLLEKIPNAELVIAGNGPTEKDMRKLAINLGIEKNVIFTGFLDHQTLSKWYKAADLFTVMCPIETQCLALMQAFATGLPSIGVNKGAVGEHIKPEFGITVPEGDERQLAQAFEKVLLASEGDRAEMGRKALEYVRQFSTAAISTVWLKEYENLFARKGRSDLSFPKISVIIPAHNEEKVISESLEAILAQDYPDFEVIVVDNDSTDKTSEIARKFPVKVVYEPKRGLLAARERGRVEAKGEIIVQMDADCLPDRDWLRRGVRHFKNPKVSAVAGPYLYFDGSPVFQFISLASQKYVYRGMNTLVQMLGTGAVLIGGNSFLRADALARAGGYDTSIEFYGEDTDTAKRMASQGKVIFDKKLIQRTSARRFKSQGTVKISALYLYYFFKVMVKGVKGQKKAN